MWYGKRPVRSKSVGPALAVLFLVNVLNFYDRQTLAAILEPLRHEFSLSDTQLGGLFTLFTVVFALAGLPLGKLADTRSRRRLRVSASFPRGNPANANTTVNSVNSPPSWVSDRENSWRSGSRIAASVWRS